MSKVEIVGAKGLLQDVLSLLRELGIFQIEPATVGLSGGREQDIRSFMPDQKWWLNGFSSRTFARRSMSFFLSSETASAEKLSRTPVDH
jgi:hypothetical protein